ncbi:MAG: hypothetical protein A3A96_03235 [Candidatus Zambryskibacteria bacterium RIFCSPLOWO2_01_FULL_39_39]|uniref:Lipoprotein n=1 Tax=Candidatus Zambryskibacteria bacterium RIFCSPLOWO2_01_FULL_39_39 TaxID=1802758 RepID=A0A1G2TWV2_9BACT|nr:MAG: hypothetical protein UT00_C0008G0024 [Parcubacteria group bacterium GW2011_GWA1_38_7]OHA87671.1 MAG: hypothetical protein A2644_02625 [Candidatus Zambryskibacteria bacterium RIFCSPHIGHO2_01_FULL_39_63]OHA94393.1 MAG: hypothetical protein A3B88_01690 [Candidatus Zambryskibacteria bacterium RIFCSPHIGHO2_02_FULL_39_19]OHA98795.1 MAG: hypothetical protein A3F20_00920 [Candidatus Zambryskibacteria bacterium RIFCSPHIGHO2_12_FULL_39_21]OHB01653.1 MAG: hypothetical protein A3A96_03235 [Candidat
MKNLFVVLSIIAVLLSFMGCGAANANNPPCDLSALKIKSIVLEGDKGDLVGTAMSRELFANGAKWTTDSPGVEIVGKVTISSVNNQTPLYAVAQAKRQAFAGIAYSSILQPTSAANQLARRIALDFCRCATEGGRIRKLSLHKK